jgi:2-C-methyl-D-erythritol 4-phosphate cytidylyltransferase
VRHWRGNRGGAVARALAEVPEEAAVVLVHDAARPLVSDEVIERPDGFERGLDGALPGRPQGHDQASTRRAVVETESRPAACGTDAAGIVASVVREAYAQEDVAAASDCSSLVEARGGRVTVVEGDPKLIKVTDVADLERVSALL